MFSTGERLQLFTSGTAVPTSTRAMSSPAQKITKLDASERKLLAAIRGFFQNEDPIVVYSLASDAAEVLEALCRRQGVKPLREFALEAMPTLSHKMFSEAMNGPRNFFKHARGPAADEVLEDFSDENNDAVLFVGSDDLVRLSATLGRDWPAEVQTMQWWFWAVRREQTGLSQLTSLSEALHGLFPDIHQRPRCEQKALGREAVAWVRSELTLADPVSKR